MDLNSLAQMVDHTLLAPAATRAEVNEAIATAQRLGAYAICLSPSQLPVAAAGLKVATVCGFPSGAHSTEVKVVEARQAAENGADEVDMVINLSWAAQDQWDLVAAEIAAVRAALDAHVLLKVIIESAALSDPQIIAACEAAERAGAQFVKTSTGFHPSGGATVHAVSLMATTVGNRLGVKASGGIRTGSDALALIAAGATRLGLSGTETVLNTVGARADAPRVGDPAAPAPGATAPAPHNRQDAIHGTTPNY